MTINFWLHKSGAVYRFVTLARCAHNPKQINVVYCSTKPSQLRNQKNKETLPAGTSWVQPAKEFFSNFRPLKNE